MQQTVKERLMSFIQYRGLSQRKFEQAVGFSNGYLDKLRHAPSVEKIQIIIDTFPDLNRTWLLTGEGEMLNENTPKPVGQDFIGGVPFYHQIECGSPDQFTACVEANRADGYILLPGVSGDFSLVAHGCSMIDSVRPERSISDGAIVVLRRVDDRAFLRWGEVYALATADGFIIKRIEEQDKDTIRCHSFNSEYPPFSVNKADIFGMARVVAVITLHIL